MKHNREALIRTKIPIGKRDMLLDEFNVQVYSSGRVDWDRLDKAIGSTSLLHRLIRALGRVRALALV